MSIHHVHLTSYSRSKGESALMKIAYRTASVMHDERTGKTWDFSKKENVEVTEMIFPENQPEMGREAFWNFVEKMETRCNANTCKDLRIALSIELPSAVRLDLGRKFVKKLVKRYGFVADLAYHNEKGNPHLHVLVNTQRLVNGEYQKIRELNTLKSGEVLRIRKDWATEANELFESLGMPNRIYASKEDEVLAKISETENRLNIAEGLLFETKTDIEQQELHLRLKQMEFVNQQDIQQNVQQQHSQEFRNDYR